MTTETNEALVERVDAILRSKPSPLAGNDRHHGTATPWAAPGPEQLA
jgi:hypothetical protein